MWLYYCKTYTADVCLHFPSLIMCTDSGLMRYETFYKMLDLYYQFSTRLGKEIDTDRLEREREKTEETIMQFLSKNKKEYIRKCERCGNILPPGAMSRICDACYAQKRSNPAPMRPAGQQKSGRTGRRGGRRR